MDIDQLWAEANAALTQTFDKQKIQDAMIAQSNSHIAQLTQRLAQQRNWALVFIACFLIAAGLWRHNSVALTSVGFLTALYLVGGYLLHRGVLELRAFAKTAGTTRSRIEAELAIVKRTLRLNTIWGMVSVPLVLVLAMASNYAIRSDATFGDLLTDLKFLRTTIISLLVIAPLAVLLGTYLTRVTFGRLTDQLEGNLEALRRIEAVG